MVAILHPVGPGPQIPVDRAVVLIGRSPECDVILDCSSKISRVHCALVQVDSDYFIRDLGSLNGVWVAGNRVEKEAKLTNGTEVSVGDVKFLFLENVAVAAKGRPVARPVAPPAKLGKAQIIDDVEVVDAVEIVEDATIRNPQPAKKPSTGSDRMPKLSVDPFADAEVLENIEIIDDVEIVDAAVADEIVVEAVEIVDDVELVDDVEIIDDVDIVDDVEIIEDVEIIDHPPRRDRSPRRLR
ncbi:MAG: FHA domain-containing protein [Planctomycetaceae bacterium]|nr:FHA domain-containing protein [Planctomycetaceae bacterium]